MAYFVQNEVKAFNNTTGKSLLELFEKTLDRLQSGNIDIIQEVEPAPEVIQTVPLAEISEYTIHQISDLELARQLTLFEWEILKCITPDQMNHAQWTTQERDSVAPAIAKLTKWFNHLTYWVASEILKKETLKERATRISFWIDVAFCCYELNNFNTLMEVVTTLSMYVIVRLKRTWKAVSQHHESKFRKLQQILSQELNYKNYRNALTNLLIKGDISVLPYLGVHLRDIIYLLDGTVLFFVFFSFFLTFIFFTPIDHLIFDFMLIPKISQEILIMLRLILLKSVSVQMHLKKKRMIQIAIQLTPTTLISINSLTN